MTEQAENTKRIAKNTLMLYVRMLFGMLVSLYTAGTGSRGLWYIQCGRRSSGDVLHNF